MTQLNHLPRASSRSKSSLSSQLNCSDSKKTIAQPFMEARWKVTDVTNTTQSQLGSALKPCASTFPLNSPPSPIPDQTHFQ